MPLVYSLAASVKEAATFPYCSHAFLEIVVLQKGVCYQLVT